MTPGNLIRLPTAAVRQVNQPSGRAARNYRAAFREANPWPGQREENRRRAERLSIFADLSQSAELAVILALLRTMPAERIEAVGVALDLFPGDAESPALLQARAVVEVAAESRRAMERISSSDEDLS